MDRSILSESEELQRTDSAKRLLGDALVSDRAELRWPVGADAEVVVSARKD